MRLNNGIRVDGYAVVAYLSLEARDKTMAESAAVKVSDTRIASATFRTSQPVTQWPSLWSQWLSEESTEAFVFLGRFSVAVTGERYLERVGLVVLSRARCQSGS